MKPQETYQERYARAKARVDEIRGFYTHLLVYILVNLGLVALNYFTTGWRHYWFIYPLLGWGIGLLAHGIGVFGGNPFTGRDWEERKIREIMEKDQFND